MSATAAEIRRLMARGLDLYGLGRVPEATECWRRVLALDPAHAEARDYLQAAAGETPTGAPTTPVEGAAPAGDEGGALIEEALALLRRGELAEGLDLLENLAAREPGRLDVQAALELTRASLLRVYRDRVGRGSHVPRVRIPPEQVMRYNLPASAGFLLSLIDGLTCVDDLLALSGMDPFDVLRGLSNLLDAGIVEARA